jgi:hypothetical protein
MPLGLDNFGQEYVLFVMQLLVHMCFVYLPQLVMVWLSNTSCSDEEMLCKCFDKCCKAFIQS